MKDVERKYKRCGEKKTYVLQMTLVNLEMHIYSIKTVLDIMSKFNKAAGYKQFIQIKPQVR